MSSVPLKILKYGALPGFLPRISALFSSGFVHVSYLMAFIYGSLRLLPPNHPYLNPANRGRFGVRHVIAEAANNLVFSKKNIDQIIIFFTILLGVVLLLIQFGLFALALFVQQDALAATVSSFPSFTDIMRVDSVYGHGSAVGATQDIAFIILDRVFGVEGIFNSCVSLVGTDCLDLNGDPVATPAVYPDPFHLALHALLHFYSIGIFIVSVFIILYYFITLAAETAATGSPFGQRVNRAWAPVRLIVFAALLVPLGGQNPGLNAAQLITLWTAKTGSNFATNGWGYFTEVFDNDQFMSAEQMIARATIPELQGIMKFMFIAKTCSILEQKATAKPPEQPGEAINAYITINGQNDPILLNGTDFTNARTLNSNGNIEITFGNHDYLRERNQGHKGRVYPSCGKVVVSVTSVQNEAISEIDGVYYRLIQDMWNDPVITAYADCFTQHKFVREDSKNCVLQDQDTFKKDRIEYYNTLFQTNIRTALDNIIDTDEGGVLTAHLMAKGWAGAALWYNRIAEINGSVTTALYNSPGILKYPTVMENVMAHHLNQNENMPADQAFNPQLSGQIDIGYDRRIDEDIATVLYATYKMWETDSYTESNFTRPTNNVVIDFLNAVLGTSGIFSMRDNADVHPLAQLSALGKGMMEATIRNLGVGTVMQGLGKLFSNAPPGESALEVIGGALTSVGLSLLIMSMILYYIIPFLPFIYFLFAVSGWIKSIFEAIVAMPLWAMAHIRIDGEGIPGRDASNGYFLLMEIFLRPILIVFGLLASMIVFSAMVQVLNQIFDQIVANVGGAHMQNEIDSGFTEFVTFLRGPIDEMFFTALYVIIVYMIALACFKLVDLIPNNILRWSGVSVATFQEGAGDPAGQITGSVYTGGTLLSRGVSGGALAALV